MSHVDVKSAVGGRRGRCERKTNRCEKFRLRDRPRHCSLICFDAKLRMAFKEEKPSKATVYRWFDEFKCALLTLADEE
ncbi:hypothetical protein EVAR_59923_1 [Eumeta japonica]|uniref:Mos1 transposase HTH domain-containing protein n=1 Tax=Eumeta variegata TaxID=151549 RepID=A0A4C1YU09_EUMVA|nr:hypothetical protein EVAR_59923_1 [Eumeta japonica]